MLPEWPERVMGWNKVKIKHTQRSYCPEEQNGPGRWPLVLARPVAAPHCQCWAPDAQRCLSPGSSTAWGVSGWLCQPSRVTSCQTRHGSAVPHCVASGAAPVIGLVFGCERKDRNSSCFSPGEFSCSSFSIMVKITFGNSKPHAQMFPSANEETIKCLVNGRFCN